jgi:hypothetical protein
MRRIVLIFAFSLGMTLSVSADPSPIGYNQLSDVFQILTSRLGKEIFSSDTIQSISFTKDSRRDYFVISVVALRVHEIDGISRLRECPTEFVTTMDKDLQIVYDHQEYSGCETLKTWKTATTERSTVRIEGESRLTYMALPWVARVLNSLADPLGIPNTGTIQNIQFTMDEPLTGMKMIVTTNRAFGDSKLQCKSTIYTPYSKEKGLTSDGGTFFQDWCQ